MQLGVITGAVSIAPQVAVLRQFNSGWSCNFGGFEYSYYRKIPTFAAAAAVTAPLGIAVDMAKRAYYADKTFPKELQKGYKSFLDAFKRIPFEEGPYYLFKNTFPLFIKHSIGPFTAFYCYDWLIDKFSLFWRVSSMPVLPNVLICATFGTYLGAVFTYPFAHTVREMVDFWPKKDGIDAFGGNYRKASVYVWFHQNILGFYPGFFKNYFWHIAPQYFSPNPDGS
jgi:solute carrier family 25 (mitochondrial oxoglutarate transporter), member 11